MKNQIIFFILSFLTLAARAGQETDVFADFNQAEPGQMIWHQYHCAAPMNQGNHVLGVGYGLECATQAVAPPDNIRSCILSSRIVYPGAQPNEIPLVESSQDANSAQFISEDRSVRVSVDKLNDQATVVFENGTVVACQSLK